ncbi:MAG: hypothetical protein WCS43_18840, partial [Verrucomicrobiota bacterium]
HQWVILIVVEGIFNCRWTRVALFVHTSLPGENKEAGGPVRSETNLEYLVSLVTALNRPTRPLAPTPDLVMETIELVTEILLRASVYHSATAAFRDPN